MSVTKWTLLSATAMLLSACAQKEDFGIETQREWCRALIEATPTASASDDPQTLEEVADIGDVIDALCKEN